MFKNLLNQLTYVEDAVAKLLDALNIKFTQSHLKKELQDHPNYPSLISIADVIDSAYGIASASLKIKTYDLLTLQNIACPYIVYIKSETAKQDVFGVITNSTEKAVELYDPSKKRKEFLSAEQFDSIYNGIVLLVEAGNRKEEEGYHKNLAEEKQKKRLNTFSLSAIPAIVILSCIAFIITQSGALNLIYTLLFTLITLAGSFIGTLLLWYETDSYSPVLKQICNTGAKVNCGAVLNSKASKIFGVSWSAVGFAYFTGGLLYLISNQLSIQALILSSWINVLALPYTAFSIYYQWRVAKQWCRLCLIVQALLLLQFMIALAAGFHTMNGLNTITPLSLLGLIGAFAFVLTGAIVLIPALQKAKENKAKTAELKRMKHSPQIFEGLLSKQKRLDHAAHELGIILGNPSATYRVIKVCNPYCGPCAKAHPALEELLHNNDEVCLQIIFTATNNENDIKKKIVAHLLAIAAQKDEQKTRKALDDWYESTQKNYDAFATRYPIKEELQEQEPEIERMRQWCDGVKIKFTPTFFINTNGGDENERQYFQLPDFYSVNDLKYILNSAR